MLVDFGLHRYGPVADADRAQYGSLPYMAPEYFREGALGPWTDVYAIGVTLYRLLVGRAPRPLVRSAASSSSGSLGSVRWDPAPRPPSAYTGRDDDVLDRVILKCLALDPRARFEDAGALADALSRVADGDRSAGAAVLPVASDWTVGRDEELQALERCVHGFGTKAPKGSDELASRPSVVLVVGAPGVGVSHLLRRFKVVSQTAGVPCYLEVGFHGRPTVPGRILRTLENHMEAEAPEARARWRRFLDGLRRRRAPGRSELSEAERRDRRAAEVALAASQVSEPVVIAVDGLHLYDEITIGLVSDLCRWLLERGPDDGFPIRLVLSFREDGPARPLLRELGGMLVRSPRVESITVPPLDLDGTVELFERRLRPAQSVGRRVDEPDDRRRPSSPLEIFRHTAGFPARIAALAAEPEDGPDRPGERTTSARWTGLDGASLDIVTASVLAGRPVTVAELIRVTGVERRSVRERLEALELCGLVSRDPRDASSAWVGVPSVEELSAEVSPHRVRRLSAALADDLSSRSRHTDASWRVEAALHYKRAGKPSRVAEHGLAAARFLKERCQHRAALEMYREVLSALPARRRALSLSVQIEMAEIYATIGDIEEGASQLDELLRFLPRRMSPERRRVLLWLGTLRSRQGDYRRAATLFEEGFDGLRWTREGRTVRRLTHREFLFFLNERAILATFLGDLDRAIELCDEGVEIAGDSRVHSVREATLNLLATRASVSVRRFEYDDAIERLRRSNEIADAIGSPANQGAVLNNLGIVYQNCDRYAEAIAAFEKAESICLSLDEGPSLVSIYGNTAILRAKRGEYALADRALLEAERLRPSVVGKQQELFDRHCRGLCALYRGRYQEAFHELTESGRIAIDTGARLLGAFDTVYAAEALLFRGDLDRARSLLEESLGEPPGGRVARMAIARLAFVEALDDRRDRGRDRLEDYAAAPSAATVPFLDAWDDLFVAWAASLLLVQGENRELRDEFVQRIGRAEEFFERTGLPPPLAMARLVRAERSFLEDDFDSALRILEATDRTDHGLARGLLALLEARSTLGILLRDGGSDERLVERVADLLADARVQWMVEEVAPWGEIAERLLSALRGDLASDGRSVATVVNASTYLSRWEPPPALPFPSGGPSVVTGEETEAPRRDLDEPSSSATAPFRPSERSWFVGRERIVARSHAMSEVLERLDRLAGSDLPLLIHGETGTGKELLARCVHASSLRASGPFVVLDARSIPPGLVEVELFGARAGAFTDLTTNRPGILSSGAGGSVFIDEIADVSAEVQAKLLRVLSEGRYRPVGATEEETVDVRFLLSTRWHPDVLRDGGTVRADFLERARVLELQVPPLRQRTEDLRELIAAFLEADGGGSLAVSDAAVARFRRPRGPATCASFEISSHGFASSARTRSPRS